jgi:GNAT superfamily N-acetyltransferase
MLLRDFKTSDEAAIGSVALAAFRQFESDYTDWPAMASNVSRMADLARTSELIIAERNGEVVGGVAYVGPHKPKAAFFNQAWPIIRMLVVSPSHRAGGIGRMLIEECLERARRDHSPTIALHTSPIMNVALRMYLRMGFEKFRDAPDIHGVPYAVYTKSL